MGLVIWAFRFSVQATMVLIALLIFLMPYFYRFICWLLATVLEILCCLVEFVVFTITGIVKLFIRH